MKTKSNWQKPIAIKLYKLIKITMSKKGITQVMLANKMGIEKGNMWKILNIIKKGTAIKKKRRGVAVDKKNDLS